MKMQEILFETPLPEDWDKDIYNERISFRKRVEYAKERAARIGAGSSRIAFEIPYQGRPTILKIAKNRKGLAQNEFESQMMEDYYARSLNLIIPMIDYDEQNPQPTWIHVEKAQKAKPSDFIREFGVDIHTLSDIVMFQQWEDRIEDPEIQEKISSLWELIVNYGLPPADFWRVANWGVFRGKLMIIDIGLSQEVFDKHYDIRHR